MSAIVPAENGLPTFQGKTLADHITAWLQADGDSDDKQWRLGAIAASLVGKFKRGAVQQFSAAVRCGVNIIYKYAKTYKTFQLCKRLQGLSWSHHLIATYAKDPEAALREADDNDYTVREMKQAISRERVIDIEAFDVPETCRIVSDLSELNGELYTTIYADPPWQYGNQGTRAATGNHYKTMSMDELIALPVGELADNDSHLWLWATVPLLPDGLRLLSAWGFTYKTNFVWCKPQMGIGNYLRVSHEILLLGVKGSLRTRGASQMSYEIVDRAEHSAKPRRFRQMVQELSPGPYLELFGREACEGWTIFGNQVSRVAPGNLPLRTAQYAQERLLNA